MRFLRACSRIAALRVCGSVGIASDMRPPACGMCEIYRWRGLPTSGLNTRAGKIHLTNTNHQPGIPGSDNDDRRTTQTVVHPYHDAASRPGPQADAGPVPLPRDLPEPELGRGRLRGHL